MNPKPLLKHFPELSELPPERQEQLLRQAHEEATGPEKRLETWRDNLLSLSVITGISVLLTFWLGPTLGLPGAVTALFIMVVVLPAFIVIQQRRYIRRLKPLVAERLKKDVKAQGSKRN